MSALTSPERTVATPALRQSRLLRPAAVALSAITAILYAALFLIVRGVETDPAVTVAETTYGAYLFLTIAYVVSTVAYAVSDRRGIWLAGAVLQVVAIGLFVVFGLGLLGPGVFEYEVLVTAIPIGLWAGVITGLQVVLLGVLGYLATLKPAGRHAA